jgi:hypothetical protein
MRQQESEPLEEFSQRIYFMALDGFDKGNPEVVGVMNFTCVL